MKKLWVFGDSFSAPFNDIGVNAESYIKYKGYKPKVYCDFISEKLGITANNCARGGMDNYSILNMICDKVHDIEDGDGIIIGWSSPTRFRIVAQDIGLKDKWISMVPGYVSEKTKEFANVFVNRGYSNLYWKEVVSWSKLISKKFNNKIVHFSPFADSTTGVPKIWIVNNLIVEDIEKETNGKIKDTHYSENGHKFLAELFINRMETNSTNIDNFI